MKPCWAWESFPCLGSSLKGVDPKDVQSSVDCISFGPVGVWNVEMAKKLGLVFGSEKERKISPRKF